MANDPKRTDDIDEYGGPDKEQRSDINEERVRGGTEDVRGVADEGEEELEETDDLEDEEEDKEGSM